MNNYDSFLERIKEKEFKAIPNFLGISYNIGVYATGTLLLTEKIDPDIKNKIFKPYRWDKIFFLLITIGIFSMPLTAVFRRPWTDAIGTLLIILPSILGFLFFILWKFFLDKEINYTINIDAAGIFIKKTMYPWKDIHGTYLLFSGNGRGRNASLIIASTDMVNYKKFNLSNFYGITTGDISKTIAAYIEFFKPAV